MSEQDGFVYSGILDGRGGAEIITVDALGNENSDDQIEWIHLDITKQAARSWLIEQPYLPELVIEGLLAENTEPRCATFENGLLIILREVNTKENDHPDDMISLRLWIGNSRIISARRRHLDTIENIKTALADNRGPANAAQFLCHVGRNMAAAKRNIIATLSDELDELDDLLVQEKDPDQVRPRVARLRRGAIQMHRYFKPQRATFAEITKIRPGWVDGTALDELAAITAEFTRLASDIESILGRAQVTQDEMRAMENHRAGRVTMTLTVVAAIFLPLSFITGLFGINVGGIPLAEAKWGFWAVTGGIAVLGIGLWVLFRNRRYL